MTPTKVYISLLGQNHSTAIYVNGVRKRITFSGSEGEMNGIYTTGKADEQKAIEISPGYGKAFAIHKVYNDSPIGNKPDVVGPGKLVNGPISTETLLDNNLIDGQKPIQDIIEDVVDDPKENVMMVFKSVNEAQALLTKAPYNVVKTKIRTTADIVAKGLELGLDITFNKEQ